MKIFMVNRKMIGLAILLLSCLIAGLDSIMPPEVPVEALYALPIWLGLWSFGWFGGLGVSAFAISFFFFSNYVLGHDPSTNLWPALLLTFSLFLFFSWGANQFIQNQRKLSRVQLDLQTRLKELDELYQQSKLLHQQNLKLAVSEERNRLAREIHDVMAQGLAAIIFQVEAAFANRTKPQIMEERLKQISELAHLNLQEARRSVANLRPLHLDGNSLPEALQQRVDIWSKEQSFEAKFSTSGRFLPLVSEVERALYRITQEALTNAARHSEANQVQVTLDYDEEEVCLTILDNGKGFDLEQATIMALEEEPLTDMDIEGGHIRKKYGLRTMEERASLIGGWATIQSKPGEGCRVRIIVPYSKALPLVPPETPRIATMPD
jgi:signal transduction histidine kinase